ncbi:unnamed protein product [Caenorhabditis bovis]|uniref:Uncharacterized protein n=1 Tax=Caenorhabditis bovis TaxID=2654633 RepID=A0A8S1F311_9PELO|nr:unnamed protein product [Caenorhabditis bovis]
MNSSIVFLMVLVAFVTAETCKLGEKRRIKSGSYYEECVPKFDTAGCYASWEKIESKRFIGNGEEIDRMYRSNSVGFRYKCEMNNGFISFSPIGCVINKKKGMEFLKLNASGKLDNGQSVKCKQNHAGEFSFEFGEN